MLHEKQFQEQSARVLFASSFLSGAAFNWFQPYLAKKLKSVTLTPAAPLAASRGFYAASEELPEAPPPEVLPREVTDYKAFKLGLTNTFGDLDAIATAERKLRDLHQTSNVASYISEFTQVTSYLSYEDNALRFFFYGGLKSNIKDELARVPKTTTLTSLKETAFAISSRLEEREQEKKSAKTFGPGNHMPYGFHQAPAAARIATSTPTTSTTTTAVTYPSAMEIDAANFKPRDRLTQSERQERIDKKHCFYCNDPNHAVNSCPLLANKPKRSGMNASMGMVNQGVRFDLNPQSQETSNPKD